MRMSIVFAPSGRVARICPAAMTRVSSPVPTWRIEKVSVPTPLPLTATSNSPRSRMVIWAEALLDGGDPARVNRSTERRMRRTDGASVASDRNDIRLHPSQGTDPASRFPHVTDGSDSGAAAALPARAFRGPEADAERALTQAARGQTPPGIRAAMHPRWTASLRVAFRPRSAAVRPSRRLAGPAPRRSRCMGGFIHGLPGS